MLIYLVYNYIDNFCNFLIVKIEVIVVIYYKFGTVS